MAPRRCERGAVALLVSAGLGLVGAAVLALDVGHVRQARHDLQVNAGGAALAALAALPDEDAARTSAFTYAAANDSAGSATIRGADDVEFGWWDPDAGTFVPDGAGGVDAPVSAVRVTAHRDEVPTNVGAVAPVLGIETTDLEATEVASVDLVTIDFEGLADGAPPAVLAAGVGVDVTERDGTIGLAVVSSPGSAVGIVDLRCGLGCPAGTVPFEDARHALVSGPSTVTFDFTTLGDGSTTPWSLRLLGARETHDDVTVVMRDASGSVVSEQSLAHPAPGSATTWFLEPVDGVAELTVELPGGGGVDDLRLKRGLTVVS